MRDHCVMRRVALKITPATVSPCARYRLFEQAAVRLRASDIGLARHWKLALQQCRLKIARDRLSGQEAIDPALIVCPDSEGYRWQRRYVPIGVGGGLRTIRLDEMRGMVQQDLAVLREKGIE